MIDPVASADLAVASLLSGAILLFATLYAIAFGFAGRFRSKTLRGVAAAAFIALCLVTVWLCRVLHLEGWWLLLPVLLLTAYLCAPLFIWRLSAAVDARDPAAPQQIKQREHGP